MRLSRTIFWTSIWYARGVAGFGAQADAPPPVVSVTIKQEKYCLGQPGGINEFFRFERQRPDTITLRLRVQLSYRNVGPYAIVVPIYHSVPRLLISRSLDDARHDRFSLIVPFNPIEPPDDARFEGIDAPDKRYEVIRSSGPRYVHPFESQIYLRVHTPSLPRRNLLGKKIFLQLELSYRWFSPALAKDLAIRWKNFGDLWTGKVRTEPIEIDIPASPEIGDCSNEYGIDDGPERIPV